MIADERLEDAGFRETGVVVLVQDRARLGAVADLRRDPDVASVARGPVSRDGRSTYLAAALRPTDDDARLTRAGGSPTTWRASRASRSAARRGPEGGQRARRA